MRVCFLPGCDKINDNWKTRPMFTPPKDQILFAKWEEVLPKKRKLRPFDKVCLLHFDETDVHLTYDTNINGKIVQIPRDRPKLNTRAIPCKNLADCDYPKRGRTSSSKMIKEENSNKKIVLKRVKVKKNNLNSKIKVEPAQAYQQYENILNRICDESTTEEPNYKFKTVEIKNNLISYEPDETVRIEGTPFRIEAVKIIEQSDKYFKNLNDKKTIEVNSSVDEQNNTSEEIQIITKNSKENNENNHSNRKDKINKTTSKQTEVTEGQKEIFNSLYEDIFEVELPSTLWGIHRDPSYKFIALTYFDSELCISSKTIILNNNLTVDINIFNKFLKNENLANHATIEQINVILVEVDNMKICLSDKYLNPLCELKLKENDDTFCKLCLRSCL